MPACSEAKQVAYRHLSLSRNSLPLPCSTKYIWSMCLLQPQMVATWLPLSLMHLACQTQICKRLLASMDTNVALFCRPGAGSGCDYALRFWVPNHELKMCGHATVGAVWLLHQLGKLSKCEVSIWTCKGAVTAHLVKHDTADASVKISQPKGQVEP